MPAIQLARSTQSQGLSALSLANAGHHPNQLPAPTISAKIVMPTDTYAARRHPFAPMLSSSRQRPGQETHVHAEEASTSGLRLEIGLGTLAASAKQETAVAAASLSCGVLLRYGSTTMAQVKVPGSRSLAVTEPSPPGPVEPEATMVPLASTQTIVDAVPPSICELTNVVMSVSGVL
jgi:hypothetical protein